MRLAVDITGKRYDRLVVVEYVGKTSNGHSLWLCRCDCGAETKVTKSNLSCGRQVSCGCKRREQAGVMNKTHGKSGTRLYRIFTNMVSRTENENVPCFSVYGGRGVSICKEWREDFSAFANWAVQNGYSDNLTLDRIDNDKGYCPDNCRWVPWLKQFENRRTTAYIEHNGKRKTIKEWAQVYQLDSKLLRRRLQDGWSFQDALETPRLSGGQKRCR